MEFQQLDVNERMATGKGASRKLRAAGRIPGIIYGRGTTPVMVDLQPRLLHKALQGPHRTNTVLQVKVHGENGDADMLVMVQDWQIHPRDRHLLHVDLLKVDLESEVLVDVPLVTTGRSTGVQMGGILLQVFHKLPVRCKPGDIPVEIATDITALGIGDTVKAEELPLPAGVQVAVEPEQTVLAVAAPQAEEEPVAVEGEEEVAEGEEAPEGEEAKPEEKAEGEEPGQ
jgi:large subunit ribosomal protein L25